mmetsp:Transcript_99192/g.296467  ORF Transcript_99192/g.296467 Transcript_99192/m.296467 type:complete len:383 (-) Transcript_99192:496-1644(-)
MVLRCDIVSSEDVLGYTSYTIKVFQGRQEKLVHRRYRDFVQLDRQELVQQLPRETRPKLPPKGCLGLRHRLDLCGFNARRLQGLQQYLDDLLRAESMMAPLLHRFLSGEVPVGGFGKPALEEAGQAPPASPLPPAGRPGISSPELSTPSLPVPDEASSGEPKVQLPAAAGPYGLRPSVSTWLLPPCRAAAATSAAVPGGGGTEQPQTEDWPGDFQLRPGRPVEACSTRRAAGAQPCAGLPHALWPSVATWCSPRAAKAVGPPVPAAELGKPDEVAKLTEPAGLAAMYNGPVGLAGPAKLTEPAEVPARAEPAELVRSAELMLALPPSSQPSTAYPLQPSVGTWLLTRSRTADSPVGLAELTVPAEFAGSGKVPTELAESAEF